MTAITTTEHGSDQDILAPALDYLEGWYAGDARRVAHAIHPELVKRFVRTIGPGLSHIEDCGASKLIAWTASGGGSAVPREHRRSEVNILDRSGWAHRGPDMAIVKVVGATGTEYLQLAELAEGWRIVNILGEPRSEAPFRSLSFKDDAPRDSQKNPPDDDRDVVKAATDYIAGWCSGDKDRATRCMHQGLSKKSVREDSEGHFFLDNFNYPKFAAWTGYWGKDVCASSRVEVKTLDRTRETASMRIDWNFDRSGRAQSLDYVDAAKVGGSWRIVNVLWGCDRGTADEDWRTWYW